MIFLTQAKKATMLFLYFMNTTELVTNLLMNIEQGSYRLKKKSITLHKLKFNQVIYTKTH